MTGTAFGSQWLGALVSDAEIAARLGDDMQLGDMLRVERAWTDALEAAGQVPAESAAAVRAVLDPEGIDRAALALGVVRDGVAVPGLVAQLRARLPEAHHPALHRGLTSQDVVDTALVMALRDLCAVFEDRIARLSEGLNALRLRFGDNPLMGRTRMQAALPVTVADRIAGWCLPLDDHAARLAQLRPRLERVQMGGPVGTRGGLDGQGDALAADMAARLGLAAPGRAWHVRRDGLAEFAGWLSLVSGGLGKMGQDICLMTQQGIGTVTLAAGGGSSAMAHKANPVGAETLVALGRFNAAQLGAMHAALEHEQERSGAAWTLEWMVLPQMALATGAALRHAETLTGGITFMGDPPAHGA
ncbi:3-carboxy-cis,cis-muconate cycloisomerase [Roseovarius sp. TE539]|uniref:3-carboxy-cis,cis-muconate cycloisomerase n=1 Tax=Roseovarius sp. TE539 TaxID=2249812 RepID=UPI000DDEB79B|nr:3-carboxy-cis,cis-muconate cycloisomerase [Roseovarius sp. TE539]RBI70879.1 3-carboxy-cis,cis-muconate cycloisomerase [Roseovarius sp. TE539]